MKRIAGIIKRPSYLTYSRRTFSSSAIAEQSRFSLWKLFFWTSVVAGGAGGGLYYISNEPHSRKFVCDNIPYGKQTIEGFEISYGRASRAVRHYARVSRETVDDAERWSRDAADTTKKAINDATASIKKIDSDYHISERTSQAVDVVSSAVKSALDSKSSHDRTEKASEPPQRKESAKQPAPAAAVNRQEPVELLPEGRPDGPLSIYLAEASKRIEKHLRSLNPEVLPQVQAALHDLERVRDVLKYLPDEQAELLEKSVADKLAAAQSSFETTLQSREDMLTSSFESEMAAFISTHELSAAQRLQKQAETLKSEAEAALREQYTTLRQKWQAELESKLDSERQGRLARLGELAEKLGKLEKLVGGMAVGLDYQAALLRARNALKVVQDAVSLHDSSDYVGNALVGADVDLRLPLALLNRVAGHLRGSCGEAWTEFVADLHVRTSGGLSSRGNLQKSFRQLLPLAHGVAYMPSFESNGIPTCVSEPVAYVEASSHSGNPVYSLKVPTQHAPVMLSYVMSRYVLAPLSFIFDIPWFQSWPQRPQPGSLEWHNLEITAERLPSYDIPHETEWQPLEWSWSSAQYVLERLMRPVGAVFYDASTSTAILKRAEYFIFEKNDLDAAAREINQLKGWPGVLCHDWLNEARKRLEFEQSLKVIDSHLTLLSLDAN